MSAAEGSAASSLRRRTAAPPIITLTTDFGLRDPYVAEMKAAVLSITRDPVLVDLTHGVSPQDVTEAALVLERAAPHFPRGTIHVAVVDPDVGTARRGLVVAAAGHFFVGPDNGIFTAFLVSSGWRAFELRAAPLSRAVVSRTFHGRDVFAPAAAHLALGVEPSRFGPRVTDPVRLSLAVARRDGGTLHGEVVFADGFGNLVTSIRAADLAPFERFEVEIAGLTTVPGVETYGELERGALGALIGSAGRLEIAVREGNAAATLGARRGTRIVARPVSRSRSTPSKTTSRSRPATSRPRQPKKRRPLRG